MFPCFLMVPVIPSALCKSCTSLSTLDPRPSPQPFSSFQFFFLSCLLFSPMLYCGRKYGSTQSKCRPWSSRQNLLCIIDISPAVLLSSLSTKRISTLWPHPKLCPTSCVPVEIETYCEPRERKHAPITATNKPNSCSRAIADWGNQKHRHLALFPPRHVRRGCRQ